ncbi:MAG: methyl-accepting chemotaxis protein [Bacteroidota bacterium]
MNIFSLFSSASGESTSARIQSQLDAIDRSQAVIEFTLDGTIVTANANFLGALGYRLDEIQGRKHRQFVKPAYASSPEYKAFWDKLRSGAHHSGRYERVKKNGEPIWIQATYNPILGADGRPTGVIKFATDVTAQVEQEARFRGKIEAIDRSEAMIEFTLDGTIVTANANFLAATGYRLDEIQGRHHRQFVKTDYAKSREYKAFWDKLRSGAHHSGRYERVKKNGGKLWLQATYNPILDAEGQPTGVIKFATDITEQVEQQHRLEAGIERMLAAIGNAAERATAIANTSSQMAVVADEQRGQSEEVAAAVEQMVRTIVENATNTAQASDSASGSEQAAQVGKQVMAQTRAKLEQVTEVVGSAAESVRKLGVSSAQIGDIVQVIEDIANQTNLLALNAAIEAARAGEQGRGFAVVADEVRKLAERTTGATKQIAEMVGAIQAETDQVVTAIRSGEAEVAAGLTLADEARSSLERIVEATTQTLDVVTQIAAATEEQSSTSEQIGRSIDTISTGATRAASAVDEMTVATQELSEVTEALQQEVLNLRGDAHGVDATPSYRIAA